METMNVKRSGETVLQGWNERIYRPEMYMAVPVKVRAVQRNTEDKRQAKIQDRQLARCWHI